jgi:hypothetical protein
MKPGPLSGRCLKDRSSSAIMQPDCKRLPKILLYSDFIGSERQDTLWLLRNGDGFDSKLQGFNNCAKLIKAETSRRNDEESGEVEDVDRRGWEIIRLPAPAPPSIPKTPRSWPPRRRSPPSP